MSTYINSFTWGEIKSKTWDDVSTYRWSDGATKAYLLGDNDHYYTISDAQLRQLDVTELTSDVFREYGFFSLPSKSLIENLKDLKLYVWTSPKVQLPTLKAEVIAYPVPQTLETNNIDISDSTIAGVAYAEVEDSGSPKYRIKFDNSEWKYYNGSWVDAGEGVGMSSSTLTSIDSDNWAQITRGISSIRVQIILTTQTDTFTRLRFVFFNESSLMEASE